MKTYNQKSNSGSLGRHLRHHLHPRQLPELMDIEESVVLGDSAIREQGEQLLCRGR